MRKCEYCGQEIDDEAARCAGCGTQFLISTTFLRKTNPRTGPRLEPPKPQVPISARRRVAMWVLAWLAAAITMAYTEWTFAVLQPILIFLFPAGLFFLLGGVLGHFTLPAGWIYYLGLTLAALRSKPRARYYVFYAALCISLVLNCAGCHWLFQQNRM